MSNAPDLHEALKGKWTDGTRPKDLYSLYVSKNPQAYLETVINGLSSDTKRVQSGSAILASMLAEEHPHLIYPYLDLFIRDLNSREPVLRWEAVCTLGNLAAADTEAVIPKHLGELTPLLREKSIVLQGHTVRALSKIAEANPAHADEILEELTHVTEFFPGSTVGIIVESLERFHGYPHLREKVKRFTEPYLESEVKVVARKARRVIKLMNKA